VANRGDGTVTRIDISTNEPGTPLAVGPSPSGLALAPNGSRLYVTDFGDATVSELSVGS